MKLSDYLKSSRIRAGLTQNSVAQSLGYTTPQFVSNWERGLSQPPMDVLKKIAGLYNISDEELYTVLEETTLAEVKRDLREKFLSANKLVKG